MQQLSDIDFAKAKLIVPRESLEIDRGTSAIGTANNKPARILRKIGLADYNNPRVAQMASVPKTGGHAKFKFLGITAAFFKDEQQEADAYQNLKDEYEFIPNFSLSLPGTVEMPEIPDTERLFPLDKLQWPEVSGVQLAHSLGIRGSRVLVGVLDTGIDADHAEFSHHTVSYAYIPPNPKKPPLIMRGLAPECHGTHVCGIIAGKTVGVAPEAELYVASAIDSEAINSSIGRVANGLEWLLKEFNREENADLPKIINMSLGFPSTPPPNIRPTDYQKGLRLMRSLMRRLVQQNVLPVIAIGNDKEGQYRYPGGFKEFIGIGSVDFQGQIADFSGSGNPQNEGVSKPDLVGYGVGVYSSLKRDYNGRSVYKQENGTSMATAYVAGIAALYRCQQPQLTVQEVREKLMETLLKLPNQLDSRVGAGLARFVSE